MKAHTAAFEVSTRGKGTYEITDKVAGILRKSGVQTGVVTVFIQHTSASLIIFENADRSARVDLEAYFERLVPEDSDCAAHCSRCYAAVPYPRPTACTAECITQQRQPVTNPA
jgi:secondary thiamine-phosphate synthase enzyme